MSTKKTSLEVVIGTVDSSTVDALEKHLKPIHPKRWKETRNLETIITVAASVIELVNGLLELKERLSKQKEAPSVAIRTAERDELILNSATKEQLTTFVSQSVEID